MPKKASKSGRGRITERELTTRVATGKARVNRSPAGVDYVVDDSKPKGERIIGKLPGKHKAKKPRK